MKNNFVSLNHKLRKSILLCKNVVAKNKTVVDILECPNKYIY